MHFLEHVLPVPQPINLMLCPYGVTSRHPLTASLRVSLPTRELHFSRGFDELCQTWLPFRARVSASRARVGDAAASRGDAGRVHFKGGGWGPGGGVGRGAATQLSASPTTARRQTSVQRVDAPRWHQGAPVDAPCGRQLGSSTWGRQLGSSTRGLRWGHQVKYTCRGASTGVINWGHQLGSPWGGVNWGASTGVINWGRQLGSSTRAFNSWRGNASGHSTRRGRRQSHRTADQVRRISRRPRWVAGEGRAIGR